MTEIRPFTLSIAQTELEDLYRRLAATRWPERETVDDWSQGAPLERVQALVQYWRTRYDWRRCEAKLNALGQHKTEIDGLDVHFLQVPSPEPNALPLIVTHGWPGSVIEFMGVIGPLTDPAAHGGDPADAFHLVIPSLPGYGWSGKPERAGWKVERIAAAWGQLMTRLGHAHWVAQGGDWGSAVTTAIGALAPQGCAGIHLNMPIARPLPEDLADAGPREQSALAALKHYQDWDSGYSKQQSTRPQTLGYGLSDSPAGQAAWIYEKLWSWSDHPGTPEDLLGYDAILDNIMLYWLPGTAASSARLYWESFNRFGAGEVKLPTGVSVFPKEIFRPVRKWAERTMPNIVHWNELEKGGHFAAWEQPGLFVKEVRDCFRQLR